MNVHTGKLRSLEIGELTVERFASKRTGSGRDTSSPGKSTSPNVRLKTFVAVTYLLDTPAGFCEKIQLHQTLMKILLSREEIAEAVARIGNEITKDFAGESVMLVGVLKGACMFLSDLAATDRTRCDI